MNVNPLLHAMGNKTAITTTKKSITTQQEAKALKQTQNICIAKFSYGSIALLDDLNQAYQSCNKKGYGYQPNSTSVEIQWHQSSKSLHQDKSRPIFVSVGINQSLSTTSCRHTSMPLPDDLMHRLNGGYYFTKIDLADAYNQVKFSPKHQ